MRRFLDELVFDMPAVSMAALEQRGETLLRQYAPSHLLSPGSLDVLFLVEKLFPQYGIHVYPASQKELGPREGATDPEGDEDIDILIAESLWEDFLSGGTLAHRSRATVIHEFSHADQHVPVVRERLRSPFRDFLLARVQRRAIPAYRDPEWQAWALAGCILIPRATINMLRDQSVQNLSRIYQVSETFVSSHLRRLKLNLRNSL